MSCNAVLAGIYGTYAEGQEKTAQNGPRTLHDLAKQIVSAGQGDDDLQKTASDITEVTAGLAQYDAAGRVAAHAFFIEMEKEAAAGDFSKLNAFFAEEEEPVVKTATLGERAEAELKRRGLDKTAFFPGAVGAWGGGALGAKRGKPVEGAVGGAVGEVGGSIAGGLLGGAGGAIGGALLSLATKANPDEAEALMTVLGLGGATVGAVAGGLGGAAFGADRATRGLDKLSQNVRVAPGYEDPTDTVLNNAGFDYGAQAPTKGKARMAVQGAVGGGLVGGLVGLGMGEALDMKHRGRLAAMGAAGGALLGGVSGHQAHGLRTTRAAEMAEKGIVLNDDGSLTLTPEAAAQFMGPAR